MSTRNGRVFIFVVSMFALAIVVFAVGVYAQYQGGQKNAQNDFRTIVQNVGPVFANGGDAASKSAMDNVFAMYPNLVAVTVKIADKPVFAQQRSQGFISMTRTEEPVITASSPMLVTQTAPFTTVNGTSAFISALLYIMRPTAVYKTACASFLIILAATVLAIVFVLLPVPVQAREPERPAPARPRAASAAVAPKPPEPPVPEVIISEPPAVPLPQDESAPDFTGESLLEDRLASELERAAEQDEDLGLLIILLPGLDRASETAEKISGLTAEQFKQTNLIFDYKDGGVAVILRNSTIEDSLKQAEQFYAAFNEELGPDKTWGIGISNRTGRAITAERFIGEAHEAAQRALQSTETPIVALKIDPEKYREYLAETA